MSALLSIRLLAVTYDEGAVFRTWPKLCALAWPEGGILEGKSWHPLMAPEALNAPIKAEKTRHGVRELAEALVEQAHFGSWPEKLQAELAPSLQKVETALRNLDNGLADWQPQAALAAATNLEDALGDMQDLLA